VAAILLSACATASRVAPAASAPAKSSATQASASAPVIVRLAYFPNFTHAIGLVAVANGSVQKALGDNKLDVKSFNAGPALIEALLAGEIDIGYIGPNPAINGYVKSKGKALRIIAGATSGGAWVPEPWGTRLIQEANGEVFVDERDLWPEGKFVTTHVIVATKFLEAHLDLVKKFLDAHVDAQQFVLNNPDEAKQIANKEIERITSAALPDKVLDAAFENVDFTYDPLPETLFVSADYAFTLGFLGDTKPDLSGIYDLTLLNEVLREKGLPAVKRLSDK
jgi:ABC-type nitrate/sulfonate/bicarbonate transport system substrate-binding protein